ncbi:hypothetical protein HDU76_004448 [Blyttiomyces sp. JEL0837]|nr:hypothetical protein HDU76_004448 [Blyttiomyces sp. JEL0837]
MSSNDPPISPVSDTTTTSTSTSSLVASTSRTPSVILSPPLLPSTSPIDIQNPSSASYKHSHDSSIALSISPKNVTMTIRKKEKGKGTGSNSTGNLLVKGVCYVDRLPDEMLILVMANLDPSDLRLAGGVSKRWQRVINDDTCWRSALESFLGSIPLRRIAKSSWRKEYLRRFRLLREWKRGSKRIMQFDPRIGRITEIMVDLEENRMYAGSLEKGMVVLCNPTTGKVEKDAIFFNADQNTMELATMIVEKSRIAVGHLNGGVSIVTNFFSQKSQSYNLRHFIGFHAGPVTKLAWIPNYINVLVSGGQDGQVRMWDVSTLRCVRIGVGNESPITALTIDPKNHVVACTESGKILIWDLDVTQIVGNKAAATPSTTTQPQQQIHGSYRDAWDAVGIIPVNMTLNASVPPIIKDPSIHTLLHDPQSQSLISVSRESVHVAIRIWSIRNRTGAGGGGEATIDSMLKLSSPLPRRRDDNADSDLAMSATALVAVCNASSSSFNDSGAGITAAVWDRPSFGAASERKASTLLTGDAMGRVCVWEIPDSVILSTTGGNGTGGMGSNVGTPIANRTSLVSGPPGSPARVALSFSTGANAPTQTQSQSQTVVVKPKPVTLIPVRVITTQLCPITTMTMDPFKFVIAFADGWVRTYDAVTGTLIRSLSVRRGGEVGAGPHAVTADRKRVSCVWGGEWRVVATVGGHVRSWDFDPGVNGGDGNAGGGIVTGKGRMKRMTRRARFAQGGGRGQGGGVGSGSTGGGVGVNGRAYNSLKAQLQHEVKQELRERNRERVLEEEAEARLQRHRERINGVAMGTSRRSFMSNLGLTEDEMVHYALMLSLEENENDARRRGERELAELAILGTSPSPTNTTRFGSLPSPRTLTSGSVSVPIRGTSYSRNTLLTSPRLGPVGSLSPTLSPTAASTPIGGSLRTSRSLVGLNSGGGAGTLAWYEDEWDEDEMYNYYWDQDEGHVLGGGDSNIAARKNSLSFSLGDVMDEALMLRELPPATLGDSDSNGSLGGSGRDKNTGGNGGNAGVAKQSEWDDDAEDEEWPSISSARNTPAQGGSHQPSNSASPGPSWGKGTGSAGKPQKFVFGSMSGTRTAQTNTASSGSSWAAAVGSAVASGSSGNGGNVGRTLLRSPRLGPGYGAAVSPRLGPMSTGVVVAPRATEDEELMYALELSLLEQ